MIKAKLFFSVNYPYPYVGNRRLYIFIRAGICHSAYCFGFPDSSPRDRRRWRLLRGTSRWWISSLTMTISWTRRQPPPRSTPPLPPGSDPPSPAAIPRALGRPRAGDFAKRRVAIATAASPPGISIPSTPMAVPVPSDVSLETLIRWFPDLFLSDFLHF